MGIVGLIPARGGSKGIPGKNIAPCAGRPLIAWTCEAAKASVRLVNTIVSTDSEAIAQVARDWGIEVPFVRPAELALDSTPSLDVMLHALEWFEGSGASVTALMLLQPTSPLRTQRHIDDAIDQFIGSGADTLVSVIEVSHRYHPSSLVRERDGWIFPYQGSEHAVNRQQDMSGLYARNGPAILIASPNILRSGRLYGERTRPYRMQLDDSVDVDTPIDLEYADFLLNRRARTGRG
jgi:CMP-N-acetylneuraminic acid synthetase